MTYDVEVRGTLTNTGKVLDKTGRVSEEWDHRFDWCGTWAGVRVEVVETQGVVAATSSTAAVLPFRRPRASPSSTAGSCIMSAVLPPLTAAGTESLLPATFAVAAHSYTGVSIVEQLTLEGADALGLADPKRPGCAGLLPPGPRAGPRFIIDSDMTAALSVTLFTIYLEREAGPARAAPVDALLRGAAFQVDAGPHVSTARTVRAPARARS